jgi:hypothetical protein
MKAIEEAGSVVVHGWSARQRLAQQAQALARMRARRRRELLAWRDSSRSREAGFRLIVEYFRAQQAKRRAERRLRAAAAAFAA